MTTRAHPVAVLGNLAIVAWLVLVSCETHRLVDPNAVQGREQGQAGEAGRGGPSPVFEQLNPSCAAGTFLFEPRALGDDGSGVIRAIRHDDRTGDTYFGTGSELYVLRAGSVDPIVLARFSQDPVDDFWVQGDEVLLPSDDLIAPFMGQTAVLMSLSRDGGEPEVRVRSAYRPGVLTSIDRTSVLVAGEHVYWIARERPVAAEGDQAASNYTLYRASWAADEALEEHTVVYRSSRQLSRPVVAGGYLFVDETWVDAPEGSERTVQRIIELGTHRRLDEPAERRYGGSIVTGDSRSLLVTRFDYDDSDNFGTWHMRPDGGHPVHLPGIVLLSAGPVAAVSHGAEWLILNLVPSDGQMAVHAYSEQGGQRLLGCFDEADFTFALEVAGGRALVGVLQDGKNAIIGFSL